MIKSFKDFMKPVHELLKNDPAAVDSYPDEVHRQFKTFHEHMKEKGIDIPSYYKDNKLMAPPATKKELQAVSSDTYPGKPKAIHHHLAATLDHLHKEFPEVAQDMNMTPITHVGYEHLYGDPDDEHGEK